MPYRIGRCADLPDRVSDPRRLESILVELRRALEEFAGAVGVDRDAVASALADPTVTPGRVAALVSMSGDARQAVLEADDRVDRLAMVVREVRAATRRIGVTRPVGGRGRDDCHLN